MQSLPDNLDQFLDSVWATLRAHRGSIGGFPGLATLATIGDDGAPTARSMVVRRVDRANGAFEMFSDVDTPKIRQIRKDGRVAVLVWSPDALLQIRLSGHAVVVTGEDAAARWQQVPDHGIVNYGVTPPPGTPIPAPNAYQRKPDQQRFAVIRVNVTEIDAVYLGNPYHVRARYRRDGGWSGEWLAP